MTGQKRARASCAQHNSHGSVLTAGVWCWQHATASLAAFLRTCCLQAKHAAEVAKRVAQVADRKAAAAAAAAAKAAAQQLAMEEQARLRAQVEV